MILRLKNLAFIFILFISIGNIAALKDLKFKLLKVNDAVLLALRYHPNVKNAQLDRVVDRFALEVAHNAFMPQYRLTGSTSWVKDGATNKDIRAEVFMKSIYGSRLGVVKNWGDSQNTALEISQPLLRGFDSDVNLSELEAARDSEYTGWLGLQDTLINTIDQALIAYWAVMAAEKGVEVQKKSLDILKKTLKAYELKVKVGQMAKASLDQQRTALLNAELLYENQLNTLNLSRQNLLMSLGLDPNASISVEEDFSAMERVKLPTLQQCIDFALKYNIAYLKQQYTIRSLYRSLLVAQDSQNWKLDATGKIDKDSWNAGVNLDIPINDLPRQQQLLQAKVSYEKGQRDLLRAKQILLSEVKNQWYNCKSQLEQIKISQQSVKSAYNDYKMALLKQMSGMTSTFEVISLQQQWVDSQLALINLKVSYLNSLIGLHAKLGTTLHIWGIKLNDFGE